MRPQNLSPVPLPRPKMLKNIEWRQNISLPEASTSLGPALDISARFTPSSPPFRYHQSNFPVLQTPHPPPRAPQTWAHITARSSKAPNQQPFSSAFDSIKSILATFDLNKLCVQLRSLALHLQETNDPIAIIDAVIGCLSASP